MSWGPVRPEWIGWGRPVGSGQLGGLLPAETRGWPHPRSPVATESLGSSRLAQRPSRVRNMEAIVLRVRLTSGDSIDVTYEDRDARSEAELIDHVVSTLSE